MTVIAVILFLAFCGATSATLVPRATPDCSAINQTQFDAEFSTRCPASFMNDVTVEQLCTDNCIGYACQYLKDNNFPSICVSSNAEYCQMMNATVPAACGTPTLAMIPAASGTPTLAMIPAASGTPTLAMIKELSIVVLLLTAFFVLWSVTLQLYAINCVFLCSLVTMVRNNNGRFFMTFIVSMQSVHMYICIIYENISMCTSGMIACTIDFGLSCIHHKK